MEEYINFIKKCKSNNVFLIIGVREFVNIPEYENITPFDFDKHNMEITQDSIIEFIDLLSNDLQIKLMKIETSHKLIFTSSDTIANIPKHIQLFVLPTKNIITTTDVRSLAEYAFNYTEHPTEGKMSDLYQSCAKNRDVCNYYNSFIVQRKMENKGVKDALHFISKIFMYEDMEPFIYGFDNKYYNTYVMELFI